LYAHFDRGGESIKPGRDEGGGCDSGSACECFAFDAAFVSPDPDHVWAEQLDEVNVCAARGKVVVESNFGPEGLHLDFAGVLNEEHCVGHAGIQGVDRLDASCERQLFIEPQVSGIGQVHCHQLVIERGPDDSGSGFEACSFIDTCQALDKAGEAAGAVPAHLRGPAVAVEEFPRPVSLFGVAWLQEQETVGADALMAVAQGDDLTWGELELLLPIIDQDEVVAGSAHLGELQNHAAHSSKGS
jgi:hypothetical protein